MMMHAHEFFILITLFKIETKLIELCNILELSNSVFIG